MTQKAEGIEMKLKRALAAASVTAAAIVVPITVAAPAQASAADCRSYLASKGYIVGPKLTSGCAQTGIMGMANCISIIWNAGTTQEHAIIACSKR
ncbi:hypothetical protein [Streptomyces sp. NPDC056600]|uniref:hypothetical protein n=1 Tax=Streptomyces sp. NPDC056600 TaxID=3345874 RepID=UPI0036B1CE1F